MAKLIIELPEASYGRLENAAKHQGKSLQSFIREWIDHLPEEVSSDPDAWSVLEEMIGTVECPEGWASETDHYLYGTPKRNQIHE